jgi:hypothetical protein
MRHQTPIGRACSAIAGRTRRPGGCDSRPSLFWAHPSATGYAGSGPRSWRSVTPGWLPPAARRRTPLRRLARRIPRFLVVVDKRPGLDPRASPRQRPPAPASPASARRGRSEPRGTADPRARHRGRGQADPRRQHRRHDDLGWGRGPAHPEHALGEVSPGEPDHVPREGISSASSSGHPSRFHSSCAGLDMRRSAP